MTNPAFLALAVACSFLSAVLFVVLGPKAAIAAVFAIGLLFICLRTSLRMVFFWCVFALVFSGMASNLIPALRSLDNLHEIFVLAIFIRLAAAYLQDPSRFQMVKPVLKICVAFVLFAIASTLFNRSSPLGLLFFLYSYLKYFLIFSAAAVMLSEDDLRFLMKSLLIFIAVQLMIQLVQYSTYRHGRILVGPEINIWKDAACGTFGNYGAHRLAHFSLILFLWTSMSYFIHKSLKWLGWSLVAGASFFLAFAEQDYLIVALYFFCLVFIFRVRSLAYRVVLLLITATLLTSFFLAGIHPWNRYAELFSDNRQVRSSGKVEGFKTAIRILNESPVHWIVGAGPGSYCSGAAFKVKGEYFRKYIEWKVKTILSTTDFLWSSFTAVLVEVGLAGYSAYLLMFSYIFFILSKGWHTLSQRSGDKSDYAEIFSALFILVYLFYLSLLSNILEWLVVVFPTILLCALAYKASFRLRENPSA